MDGGVPEGKSGMRHVAAVMDDDVHRGDRKEHGDIFLNENDSVC